MILRNLSAAADWKLAARAMDQQTGSFRFLCDLLDDIGFVICGVEYDGVSALIFAPGVAAPVGTVYGASEAVVSSDLRKRGIAERRLERMHEGRAAFLERLNDEARKTGMELSVWSAMNALTGFVQHDKVPTSKTPEAAYEARCERNLFGLGAQRTHEVLAASLAFGLAS